MTEDMNINNRGAVSSLKGYRIQVLYTIYRILETSSNQTTFIPEGKEDLDILNVEGHFEELVQIKNYSSPLVLSDIISQHKSSFLTRSAETYNEGWKPQLLLVSFGEIGQELSQLFSSECSLEKFNSRFKKYNLNKDAVEYIKSHTTIVVYDEKDITNKVIELIKGTNLGINPKVSLDLLHSWIYTLSEKGGRIRKDSLLDKLNDIGRFINERQQFHDHFYNSIVPFDKPKLLENEIKRLTDEFYVGVGAKYEHILAGLDVIREGRLDNLYSLFDNSNIVIVRGASGQGKTTLAYRYINGFSDLLSYQIVPLADIQQTTEQIQALKGIAKSLAVPVLLYLDVVPGNDNWLEIVKYFSHSNAFKFLITIREEDWNRTPTKGADFTFSDLELDFNKSEAELIYTNLNKTIVDLKFLDFEEAWLKFGGKGPLLEFTYLITQGQSLQSRIKSQVTRIEKENPDLLELLTIVSLADANGAKVKVDALQNDNIVPVLKQAVELFEKEYLLKYSTDQRYLLGLHSIRSKIVCDTIIDGFISLPQHYIEKCIELIDESDLFTFLVNVTLSSYQIGEISLVQKLKSVLFKRWVAYQNISKFLLWLGLKKFTLRHEAILSNAYERDGSLIVIQYLIDFTGTLDPNNFPNSLDELKEKVNITRKELEKNEINTTEVFRYYLEWASSLELSRLEFHTDQDLIGFGEFLFWLGELLPNNNIITLDESAIKNALESYSVPAISKALFGLNHYSKAGIELARKFENIFLNKIRHRYRIPILTRDSKTIKAHFVMDVYEDFEENIGTVHERKIEIINLLREAIPSLEKYGTKGYGHEMYFLQTEFDDSICDIPSRNLPISHFVNLNSLFNGLFVFNKRPATWEEYVDLILQKRKQFLEYLESYLKSLELYFKKNRNIGFLASHAVEFINSDLYKKKDKILLPKAVSDPIGAISEHNIAVQHSEKLIEQREAQTLILKKFQNFLKVQGDYFNALENFSWQSIKVVSNMANAESQQDDSTVRASLISILDASINLKKYQDNFRFHFEKYLEKNELSIIEKSETKAVETVVFSWKQIVHSSRTVNGHLKKEAQNFLTKTKFDFERKLKAHCKNASKNSAIVLTPKFDEKESSITILADSTDPFETVISLQIAYELLHQSIGSLDYLSIKRLVLENCYSNFYVIPTVLGRALNDRVYKFSLHSFSDKGGFESVKPHDLIPQSPGSDFFEKLGIELYSKYLPGIQGIEVFMADYGQLTLNLNLMVQLKDLLNSDDLDEIANKILNDYLNDRQLKSENNIKGIHDILVAQLSKLENKIESTTSNEDDLELFQLLKDVWASVLPIKNEEGVEEIRIELKINDIEQWQERLQATSDKAYGVYLYLLREEIFEA